jgi:hypothetical protein
VTPAARLARARWWPAGLAWALWLLTMPARVNLPEARSYGNHCVVAVSSLGWLIQTAVGSAGGSGGLWTKRSGCSA